MRKLSTEGLHRDDAGYHALVISEEQAAQGRELHIISQASYSRENFLLTDATPKRNGLCVTRAKVPFEAAPSVGEAMMLIYAYIGQNGKATYIWANCGGMAPTPPSIPREYRAGCRVKHSQNSAASETQPMSSSDTGPILRNRRVLSPNRSMMRRHAGRLTFGSSVFPLETRSRGTATRVCGWE